MRLDHLNTEGYQIILVKVKDTDDLIVSFQGSVSFDHWYIGIYINFDLNIGFIMP